MAKFSVIEEAIPHGCWGPAHKGEPLPDHRGWRMRQHIPNGTLPRSLAKTTLESIDATRSMIDEEEFVRLIASLESYFPEEMQKRSQGSNILVSKQLYTLTAPRRRQWLFNHLRHLQLAPARQRPLFATGTTANEATHASIKSTVGQLPVCYRNFKELQMKC